MVKELFGLLNEKQTFNTIFYQFLPIFMVGFKINIRIVIVMVAVIIILSLIEKTVWLYKD